MVVATSRRLFTTDEFQQMVEAGIFEEDERIELIEGEIIRMSPIGPRHAWGVKRLNQIFASLGQRVIVSVQDPFHADQGSQPQPDLALLRPDTSQERHPESGDVLLAIEVMDSSVDYDRGVKRPLYARAGVAELWLVDLVADRIEVYRDPSEGEYRLLRVYGRGQSISPLFAPDLTIDVDAILGPSSHQT